MIGFDFPPVLNTETGLPRKAAQAGLKEWHRIVASLD